MTTSDEIAAVAPVKLLDWLADPSASCGISYTQGRGDWERVSYRDLAVRTVEIARDVSAAGAVGSIVPLLMHSGPRFVAAFFGVLLAGGTPAPIATPGVFEDPDVYKAHLSRLMSGVSARVVVAEGVYERQILEVTAPQRPTIVTVGEGFSAMPRYTAPESSLLDSDIALLQFSSGSSGNNRAVKVPVTSLEANTNAIAGWLDLVSGRDAWATWLPVHHDMGLIGALVTPVIHGVDVWAMPPERFIRDPLAFLGCFGEHRATVTAMPSFGLSYVARKVSPGALTGLDFSSWKALVCGAERVSADAVRDFSKLLGPAGFDEKAVLPAYGMAEATLAVTGKKIGAATKQVRVASSSLRLGQAIDVVSDDGVGNWHVGCGTPQDVEAVVEIVQDESVLGEGVVGEIAVSGPSVAAGYHTDTTRSTSRFEEGKLYTGDVGFLYEGELFVVGRMGDSVKVRGKSVFAEDADASLHSIDGLGSHNAVCLLGLLDQRESIVALVEQSPGEWVAEVGSHLESHFPSMRVVVLSAPRGTLMRTTSGKPRRLAMWQQVLDRWETVERAFDTEDRQPASSR